MTPEQMLKLRNSYDTLADKALLQLQVLQSQACQSETAKSTSKTTQAEGCPFTEPPTTDLFTLLQTHHSTDPVLSKLWKDVCTVPEWVDWDQIGRGQDVIYRYGLATLTGLAFQSLLGGLGAGRVVETLSRTGGFDTNIVKRRLFETTMHILLVTRNLEDVKPGGEGWVASVRVRLLHSAVRQRILSIEKENPGYYNVAEWGIPANDLDSIATITTFSSSLLFQALPRQGLFPTKQETTDYLALWRYIAYLMGTPHSPYFSSPTEARRMLEVLLIYEINPSEVSCILAKNMLNGMANTPPNYASLSMLSANARWLNGHDLCDALDIPRPNFWYYILMAGQCLFFMASSYLARILPPWEAYRQRFLRKAFWYAVVDSDGGLKGNKTKFEMKYIPKLGKMTQLRKGTVNVDEGKIIKVHRGIEARNLKTIVIGVAVLLLSLWLGVLTMKKLLASARF
jgi:hypothetical protein